MDNQVNADEFVERFMTGDLGHLQYQQLPVKIFKISEIAPFIKVPTPPILLGYNLIVHLTEGFFNHQIGPREFIVNAPAVLISNYGNVSTIKSVSKSAEGYCVLIKEEAMTSIFREQEILNIFTIAPLLNLSDEDNEDLANLLSQLFKELRNEDPYLQLSESLLKSLLLKIIKLSASHKVLNRKQEIAMTFKKLVHQHFKEQKSLSFYADKLAVSTNYLNRCVYDVFKKSSKDLILEVLIMHSQLLLHESTKTVTDICYELNFSEPSYFSRIFKKKVGMSPAAYRESIK
ncbi:helix-turn-helix domain-containing protein [Sphingobacterium hungaricum]|uniref:AraC family transcriptional regulator n=1 Tax=Sphingobacterium hungaricum TaxID=2082723 RepID=A0A928UWN5_9SPHI|nr:AraC family transcriptional regulator [Sphingobacterium hungaricum]MBE8714353.1 AraC family transcriptional regulator [Sphingobacterium hungaricum]